MADDLVTAGTALNLGLAGLQYWQSRQLHLDEKKLAKELQEVDTGHSIPAEARALMHGLISSSMEADRDILEQQTVMVQNILLCSTVSLTGNFALIIEGELPTEKINSFTEIMYSLTIALSTLTLFLSIVVGVAVLHRTEISTRKHKADHARATRNVMLALDMSARPSDKKRRYLSRLEEQQECKKVLARATSLLVEYSSSEKNRMLHDPTKHSWARRLEIMFWLGTFLMGMSCTELFYCKMKYTYENVLAADVFMYVMVVAMPGTFFLYWVISAEMFDELVHGHRARDVTVSKKSSAREYLQEVRSERQRTRHSIASQRRRQDASERLRRGLASPRRFVGRRSWDFPDRESADSPSSSEDDTGDGSGSGGWTSYESQGEGEGATGTVKFDDVV